MENALKKLSATTNSISVLRRSDTKYGTGQYEASVADVNLLYHSNRPFAVLQPSNLQDVKFIITAARENNIKLATREGGTFPTGFRTSEDSLLLDLKQLREVNLDLHNGKITLGGGCIWSDAYWALVNGGHDGYVINGDRFRSTSVTDFCLSGGLGPFSRCFGMGCDSLISATIITAHDENRLVKVSKDDHPEDVRGNLFWALRGGGDGNLGVIVELELEVNKLRDETVVTGRYNWRPKFSKLEVTGFMNQFYSTDWPNEITINTSWVCDVNAGVSDLFVRFSAYFNGSKDEFDSIISKNISHAIVREGLIHRCLQETSTYFLHEAIHETAGTSSTGGVYHIFTSFVFKNEIQRIKRLTHIIYEEMMSFMLRYAGQTAMLEVTFLHTGGEVKMIPIPDTAFYWRDCSFIAYASIKWESEFIIDDTREFLGAFKDRLRAESNNEIAGFLGFPDASLSDQVFEDVYYGKNKAELRKVKEMWDEEGFWNWQQSIRLTSGEARYQDQTKTFSWMDEDQEDPYERTDSTGAEISVESQTPAPIQNSISGRDTLGERQNEDQDALPRTKSPSEMDEMSDFLVGHWL